MMSVERAKKILQCYGGQPKAWPEQEQFLLLKLLQQSSELRDLQQEALEIDSFITLSTQTEIDLLTNQETRLCAENILQSLPKQDNELQLTTKTQAQQKKNVVSNKIMLLQHPVLLAASVILIVSIISSLFLVKEELNSSLSLTDYMVLYVEDSSSAKAEEATSEALEIIAFLEPQILEDY